MAKQVPEALPPGTSLHVWFAPCNLCGVGYRCVLDGGPFRPFRRCEKSAGEYPCKGFLTLLGISIRRDGKEVAFVSSAEALSQTPFAPVWPDNAMPLPEPPGSAPNNRVRRFL